ncbi:bifunctional folylpolyglutamate synthase/dihydrofolate synthase [Segetibacter sp. 3557_3]|uniref:bifunctional folylpolyglutamate synthase/dihydrofolate synthase n=1 Tax=Segetibacter sp. 3557_3 TaxID=2547429 RepID=UPI001058FBD2|nr:folylpolyglutamate synthase/dihydrofolate synthase family protein [Segetibacter sp. 3557_3]TDH28988.1 bifunctional folylpolyglutamate synthase/dihydrofolate synthase [Segetibacter sp. 3557_3]
MDYRQTLDYLFTQLPMFSREGISAYKKDLTNTIKLCEALGNPQEKFRCIHIGGTNGKGSTSHMLASILQTAGYKTGLYTSPHLRDFRERIRINGEMCNEDFVVEFTERIKPLIEELQPSFFEITVAMAFEYFYQQGVELAVIEVGLGGRLDSTNIITPELSIITNIGWDHMNMLGDSLDKIALEKAGIIKPGIPVVIGEATAANKKVFDQHAAEAGSQVSYAQEQRWISEWRHEHEQLVVTVASHNSEERMTYHIDLAGLYQKQNLLTVLESIPVLRSRDIFIDLQHVKEGLSKVKKLTGLHGRWEIIHHSPCIVLDVAHNEDGIRQVIKQLEISDYHHLHIVIGMVRDKETRNILSLLPSHARYYFTKANIPRALDTETLLLQASKFHLKGNTYDNVKTALQEALNHADSNDMILVCGSVFVVGEVNQHELKFS